MFIYKITDLLSAREKYIATRIDFMHPIILSEIFLRWSTIVQVFALRFCNAYQERFGELRNVLYVLSANTDQL